MYCWMACISTFSQVYSTGLMEAVEGRMRLAQSDGTLDSIDPALVADPRGTGADKESSFKIQSSFPRKRSFVVGPPSFRCTEAKSCTKGNDAAT